MVKSERMALVFFLALSLYICQQAAGTGLGTLRKPGPGLLSFGAGVGMGILSAWLLLSSLVTQKKRASVPGLPTSSGNTKTARAEKLRLVIISGSLFCYTLAVPWLGFVSATFILALFLLGLLKAEKWYLLTLKAAGIAIGNYLFFVQWLGLSLPRGFLF